MLLLLFAAAAPGKERAALQADLDSLATTLDSMLGHFARAPRSDPSNRAAMLATLNQERRRTMSKEEGYASLLGVAKALKREINVDGGMAWFTDRLVGAIRKSHADGKDELLAKLDAVSDEQLGAAIQSFIQSEEINGRPNQAYVSPAPAAEVPVEAVWCKDEGFIKRDDNHARDLLTNLYLALLDTEPFVKVFSGGMSYKEFYEGWMDSG